MKICIVYDCLFPWTIGGAERWYRGLAERLADEGHEVTYLTRRQWKKGEEPLIRGVKVVPVSPGGNLYSPRGTRRLIPPLLFGIGVLSHLILRGGRYDTVHTASFPYFSVIAASMARRLHRYRIVIDWHEVWTGDYWKTYVGLTVGQLGEAIQEACIRVPHTPFCFSELHRRRLLASGIAVEPVVLEGEYDGPLDPPRSATSGQTVVFAARQIPEKNGLSAMRTIAAARERGLGVDAVFFGDGPELAKLRAEADRLSLEDCVRIVGFAPREDVDEALADALCLLHPSSREGYGLVVIEAASRGTPVILAAGTDNAAVELVDEGINGFVAQSSSPGDLADALERVIRAGPELRRSTREWFEENAGRLSIEGSLRVIARSYEEAPVARE